MNSSLSNIYQAPGPSYELQELINETIMRTQRTYDPESIRYQLKDLQEKLSKMIEESKRAITERGLSWAESKARLESAERTHRWQKGVILLGLFFLFLFIFSLPTICKKIGSIFEKEEQERSALRNQSVIALINNVDSGV